MHLCTYIYYGLAYITKPILVNELGRHHVVAFVEEHSGSCSQTDAVGTGKERENSNPWEKYLRPSAACNSIWAMFRTLCDSLVLVSQLPIPFHG